MRRNIISVPIRKIHGGGQENAQDLLAVEEPLEIRVNSRNVAITMRTPGNDAELAAGFLFTEGLIHVGQAVPPALSISKPNPNQIEIEGAPELFDLNRLDRHFYISSSCGVCGKASIESLESTGCTSPPRDGPLIDVSVIHLLPEKLRARQITFERTGGLHGAALFNTAGELIDLREDVGRHNAVDKLIGAALLRGGLPLHDHILLLSGRASFELVQKALMAGIAVIAAVGAPSSLAVETALRFGMTLAGFVRDGRFNIYSGDWRVRSAGCPAR